MALKRRFHTLRGTEPETKGDLVPYNEGTHNSLKCPWDLAKTVALHGCSGKKELSLVRQSESRSWGFSCGGCYTAWFIPERDPTQHPWFWFGKPSMLNQHVMFSHPRVKIICELLANGEYFKSS